MPSTARTSPSGTGRIWIVNGATTREILRATSRSNQVSVLRSILASLVCFIALNGYAQTAEELVAKNLQAKGGIEKIKAIKSVRMTGDFDTGGFKAIVGELSKRP